MATKVGFIKFSMAALQIHLTALQRQRESLLGASSSPFRPAQRRRRRQQLGGSSRKRWAPSPPIEPRAAPCPTGLTPRAPPSVQPAVQGGASFSVSWEDEDDDDDEEDLSPEDMAAYKKVQDFMNAKDGGASSGSIASSALGAARSEAAAAAADPPPPKLSRSPARRRARMAGSVARSSHSAIGKRGGAVGLSQDAGRASVAGKVKKTMSSGGAVAGQRGKGRGSYGVRDAEADKWVVAVPRARAGLFGATASHTAHIEL